MKRDSDKIIDYYVNQTHKKCKQKGVKVFLNVSFLELVSSSV